MISKHITEAIGDTQALEKIRPDLNIEKWSIWQPAKSKNAPDVRLFEREVTLLDGSKLTAQVEIGFTHDGTLTTEDQKAYYALVKIWEDERYLTEDTHFYLRRFIRLLKKGWGTNTRNRAIQCLLRLRSVPFTWLNSYHDVATGKTFEKLTRFTILSKLDIFARKDNPETYHGAVSFRFDENILDCLSNNYTKPLLFDTAISFKREIAQLLYPHIDLVMADKHQYERRTKGLFDDLGLKGKAYMYPSKRKQTLEPALNELQGVQLSTGILVSATLEKTSDGKDYKVVFIKKAKRKKSQSRQSLTSSGQSRLVHELCERGFRPEAKAVELVAKCSEKQVKQWIEIYDSGLITIAGLNSALTDGWQPTDEQIQQIETQRTQRQEKELREKAGEIQQERTQEAFENFLPKDKWIDEQVRKRKEIRAMMTQSRTTLDSLTEEEMRQQAMKCYPESKEDKLVHIRTNDSEFGVDIETIMQELQTKAD